MLELVLLALVGVAILGALALFTAVAAMLKLVLWVVLLPLRVAFWLLLLPLLLLKFVFGVLLTVLVAPVIAIVVIAGVAAALFAVAVPLLPLIALGVLLYLLLRASTPAFS